MRGSAKWRLGFEVETRDGVARIVGDSSELGIEAPYVRDLEECSLVIHYGCNDGIHRPTSALFVVEDETGATSYRPVPFVFGYVARLREVMTDSGVVCSRCGKAI